MLGGLSPFIVRYLDEMVVVVAGYSLLIPPLSAITIPFGRRRSLIDLLFGSNILYRRDVRMPDGGRAGFEAITVRSEPGAGRAPNIPAGTR